MTEQKQIKRVYLIVYGKCKNQVKKDTLAGFAIYKGNIDVFDLCAEGSSCFVLGIFLNKRNAINAIKRVNRDEVTFKIKECLLLY